MENNLTSKILGSLKKYGYWIALGVSLTILITVICLAALKQTPVANQEEEFLPVVTEEIKFANPLENPTVLKDYSDTKLQYSNTLNVWQSHKGIDFAAKDGDEVYAVMDGKILEVSYNYMLGNVVKLDIGNNLVVVYASLSNDVKVKAGDTVKRGSVLGYVGATAKSEVSDGAHLHFEVLLNGEKVDPNLYLELSNK